jgi:hypothetical protein
MDYRGQLTGHIKGNKRLRRRVDALKQRVGRLEYLIGRLVTAADMRGYGDEPTVLTAARTIGWERWADEKREMVARRAEELRP